MHTSSLIAWLLGYSGLDWPFIYNNCDFNKIVTETWLSYKPSKNCVSVEYIHLFWNQLLVNTYFLLVQISYQFLCKECNHH